MDIGPPKLEGIKKRPSCGKDKQWVLHFSSEGNLWTIYKDDIARYFTRIWCVLEVPQTNDKNALCNKIIYGIDKE